MVPNGVELSAGRPAFLRDLGISQSITERGERFVAFFGGSGIPVESVYYTKAVELAGAIAAAGGTVLTGGGPGIMEAGNRGAQQVANGSSYGLLVNTIHREFSGSNAFIDPENEFVFHTLSVRLLTLISNSRAVVLFPGGFGTFEELFSLLVRVKVEMMRPLPIYLFGSRFWNGLIKWLEETVMAEGTIEPDHLKLFKVEDDSVKIANEIIENCLLGR
ncbi:MAG: TIGR00730 family Rossman fold protein [Holosporales bacterium]|nr:TIGR00730 family Rossman fold protein [Holosporales bacterium]